MEDIPTQKRIVIIQGHFQSLSRSKKFGAGILFLIFLLTIFYHFFLRAPSDFPQKGIVSIENGESLQAITNTLHDEKIVRSPLIFRTLVIFLGGEKKIIAGDYYLEKKTGPLNLAYRFIKGDFQLEVRKVTIPEGWNIFQIADYFENSLISFNKSYFLLLAKGKEGYLFPDTYFVSPVSTSEILIKKMEDNFKDKISNIPEISTSTKSLKDIIIIASILEAEARTTESRRTIAGILYKRLSIGMPLQVDSTFLYINGKNTYELTLEDLKIDSLYNTYKYNGLPPGPIGNPGLDSILAALNPIKTKYLYFLSSRSGDMYYAQTFEQHKRNKELYLNK